MQPRNDNHLGLIERALEKSLPRPSLYPPQIHEAMRYGVLGGGKRFRPLVVLAACEAVGGRAKQAILPACAVEMIHAYSLIHDDLPALDNDETRRGKPTCHKRFGEALAILAGDALLTQAFRLLSETQPAHKSVALIRELSEAAGTSGMIGGQVADILISTNGKRGRLNVSSLDYISRYKTGRLIEASAVLGAIVGTSSVAKLKRIRQVGRSLGLAFQVIDDIMDGNGYLQVMQPDDARKKAEDLIQQAQQETASFGNRGKRLLGLADFLLSTINQTSNVPVGLKA